ncbi:MAG: 1,4-alpha-glucan-branching enzyme, partial [Lentisphaeria bacterium]|nr:1,4-alpha-glucan-branching enzyme [Lentisphaeria bacterium]
MNGAAADGGKRTPRRANLPTALGSDPYLAPYLPRLAARRERADALEARLTQGRMSLAEFACAHEYYGLHRRGRNWIFREYAPHAEKLFLVGDFSDWREEERFALHRADNGAWELELPADALRPGMHYLLHVRWRGGSGERIPAYARNVAQDPDTLRFSAVVPPLEHYRFRHAPPPRPEAQLIYEAHVGMAGEKPAVATFAEFREHMLPRIARAGYNTVQLMAIPGHPYYGSFGYHVANFYAVAGRFGTPEEFKELVYPAHGLGLRVLIDLVHSHAVKNEVEGIAAIDGRRETYFHAGGRGEHPAWDSLCFDYGK